MGLDHAPCLESLSTPTTQYRSLCVIKSIIYGLHPIIILPKKFICIQTKNFLGCYTSRIIYIYKNHVYFGGSGFPGSHRKLRTPSNTFTGIHRWGSCLTITNGFFHSRGCLFLLVITRHIFYFTVSYNRSTLLDVIPLYLAHPIKHHTQC